MFDSDLGANEKSVVRRRAFLVQRPRLLRARFLWSLRRPRLVQAEAAKGTSEEVTIVEFSDSGERLKTVHVPKVVKTEDEWRKQLSRGVFAITRQADTELAYSGQYWNLHEKGLYRCICCDNALFISDTKFDSGTGWPSFWAPIAPENVRTTRDASLGMDRTAVSCTCFEMVLPSGDQPHMPKLLDVEMLLFPGGHERTSEQHRQLFASSGLRLTRIIPTNLF